MWDIYWILPRHTDCSYYSHDVLKCWRCISPVSAGKGQLALGPWDRGESAKKCCAERLTAQQVQRVFYDVHIKSEDRYFWCSAGVESGSALTGRKSHSFPEVSKLSSSCITQYSSPHPMDQTDLTLPLAFLVDDIGFLLHLWAQFGLDELKCCRCLDLGVSETDSVLPVVTELIYEAEFLLEGLNGALSNPWTLSTFVSDH